MAFLLPNEWLIIIIIEQFKGQCEQFKLQKQRKYDKIKCVAHSRKEHRSHRRNRFGSRDQFIFEFFLLVSRFEILLSILYA